VETKLFAAIILACITFGLLAYEISSHLVR